MTVQCCVFLLVSEMAVRAGVLRHLGRHRRAQKYTKLGINVILLIDDDSSALFVFFLLVSEMAVRPGDLRHLGRHRRAQKYIKLGIDR